MKTTEQIQNYLKEKLKIKPEIIDDENACIADYCACNFDDAYSLGVDVGRWEALDNLLNWLDSN